MEAAQTRDRRGDLRRAAGAAARRSGRGGDPHRRRRDDRADRRAPRGRRRSRGDPRAAAPSSPTATAWSPASAAGARWTRGGSSDSTRSPTRATTASSCCCPARRSRAPTPRWTATSRTPPRFVAALDQRDLERAGIRIEDKGAIVALHWRGRRERGRGRVAGPRDRRGRRLEGPGRPPRAQGAGDPAQRRDQQGDRRRRPDPLAPVEAALYGGDDRTDVDAFAALRTLHEDGVLKAIACIGVASDEAPPEVAGAADLTVDGPRGLRRGAAGAGRRAAMAFCDLLRMTVLLAGGGATALAAITVLAANAADDTRTLIVAAVWWAAAVALGLIFGRPRRAADAMRPLLAEARMTPTLPHRQPQPGGAGPAVAAAGLRAGRGRGLGSSFRAWRRSAPASRSPRRSRLRGWERAVRRSRSATACASTSSRARR